MLVRLLMGTRWDRPDWEEPQHPDYGFLFVLLAIGLVVFLFAVLRIQDRW